MSIVSYEFGDSGLTEAKRPGFSLGGRVAQHTPTDWTMESYMNFTDLALAPSGSDSGNVVASANVPMLAWTRPGGSGQIESYDWNPQVSGYDERMFGHRAVEHRLPWFNGEIGASSHGNTGQYIRDRDVIDRWSSMWGTNIRTFHTRERALEYLDEHDSAKLRVAIVVTGTKVEIMHHDHLIWRIADQVKRDIEYMMRWNPAHNYVGLGHLDSNGQTAKPQWSWEVGHVFYGQDRFMGRGFIYAPQDYLPFAPSKKYGRYMHLFQQAFHQLYACLTDYTNNDAKHASFLVEDYQTTQSRSRARSEFGRRQSPAEVLQDASPGSVSREPWAGAPFGRDNIAFVDGARENFNADNVTALGALWHAGYYGVGSAPNSPETAPDHESIVAEARSVLCTMFTSGYAGMDWSAYFYELTQEAMYGDTMIGGRSIAMRARARLCWTVGSLLHFAVATAVSSSVQLLTSPVNFVYVGGPKPQDVVSKFLMNFRPDVSVGTGGNSLPFTLIPRRLAAAEILTRVPTLFPAVVQGNDRMSTANLRIRDPNAPRNVYLGPRDPVVLNPGSTVEHVGRIQVTHIEPNEGEEYYKTQPLIFADGQYRSLRYRRSTYSALDIHSPVYSVVPTALGTYGFWLSQLYDKQPVAGPQYRDQMTQKTMSRWVIDALDESGRGGDNIRPGDVFQAIMRKSVPTGGSVLSGGEAQRRFDRPLARELEIENTSVEGGLPDIYNRSPSVGVDTDNEGPVEGGVDFIVAQPAPAVNLNPAFEFMEDN